MKSVEIWILLLCTLIRCSLTARILAILPFPGKSHHIFSTAIMKALAKRGHHLVEYSPYPSSVAIPNHTHFEIHTEFEKSFDKWTFKELMAHIEEGEFGAFGNKVRRVWNMNYGICEDTFKNEKIKKLLSSNETFDLILTESSFGQESLLIFGHRFSAHIVTIECFFPWSVLNRDAGNALSLASVPDLFSDLYQNELLSFKERMLNFVSVSLSLIFYHFNHLPIQEEILRINYEGSDIPPLTKMVSNVSLYLINSYPGVVNFVHPYTPNMIPIGGINIVINQTSTVPQDILNFINGAKEGFIYFSLGTVVPAHHMAIETVKIFTNVFKKLPQRILWKIDLNEIPNLPNNVMLRRWVPQLEILGHPNCQLMITQGGLFTHHEAFHAGVPTVNIPFLADQPYNTRFRELRGVGIGLNIATLSEESLHKAITTITNNNMYKENAARLSRIYRDRPMSAADTAVFWLEYVLKHNGAHHLRPVAAQLSWYQLALLDVGAVVALVIVLLVTCVWAISLRLLRLIWYQKKHKAPSNLNKKSK